jgi:hypothetical protein
LHSLLCVAQEAYPAKQKFCVGRGKRERNFHLRDAAAFKFIYWLFLFLLCVCAACRVLIGISAEPRVNSMLGETPAPLLFDEENIFHILVLNLLYFKDEYSIF